VLRLNLVAWPPTPVAPASCSAQLSFVDKLGNPAGPAPKVVNLSQGHADFLDVAGSANVEIHVGSPNGPLFASGGNSGSAQTGPWVTDVTTFYCRMSLAEKR
jgi:hypothetical protein